MNGVRHMEFRIRELLRKESTRKIMSDIAKQINHLTLHQNAEIYIAVKQNKIKPRRNVSEGVYSST